MSNGKLSAAFVTEVPMQFFTSKDFKSWTSPCAHLDSSFTVCHGDTALFWVGIRGEAYTTFLHLHQV